MPPWIPGGSLSLDGPRPWADVRAYGAVGDGVANDAPKFADAIAAAAVAGGGTVYVPGGTYLLGSAITLTAGVELVGEGVNRTIIRVTGTHNGIGNAQSNTRIAHLTLRGPNSVQTPSQGINSGSASHVIIEHCVIEQWGSHGINSGGTSSFWKVHDCVIQDNKNDGILLGSGTLRCVIAHNTVQNNGANGIDLNGSYNVVIGNLVHANGARFAGTGVDGWGILAAAVSSPAADANFNVIKGNVVTNTTMQGIIVRPVSGRTANYNVITSNYIEGVGTADTNEDGITIDGSSAGTLEGNIIVGNTVRACRRHGISVDGAVATTTRTLVQGNSATGNSNTGIRISGTDSWVMGNVALANTTAQIDDSGSTRTSKIANKVSTADNYIAVDNIAIGGGGTPIQRHLSSAVAWDPPNLASGTQTTTTVTVTAAALGNTVLASFSLDLQGLQLTGYVSSANTVTVVLRNGTAAAVNLGSGTLRADVWQH